VVPKNQKNTRLINAMFEKRTKFEDSLFYDISAWTFPLAFNLDYIEGVSTANAGNEISNLQMKSGNVSTKSNYAYLMEWHEYYTPKALNTILSQGVRAKVSLRPFSIEGNQYDYGTILIPVHNQSKNADELHTFLNEVAQASHVQIRGVSTGLTQGVDLGSSEFKTLEKAKIALLVGNGISSYDAGEIWHLFDTRYNITVTKLDTDNLNRTDLSRYNTIIAVSGSVSGDQAKKLKEWAENGGTLIGFGNALRWLNSNELIKLDIKNTDQVAKNITYEERDDFRGAQQTSGAIFEAKLDRSHPINFGYKNNTLALFRDTNIFVKPDKQSFNNPIKYTADPLLAGYISRPNLDSLANTVPFQVGRLKRGKVVVFTDNTNFRAFWYGTNKLLMNAIFFRDEL